MIEVIPVATTLPVVLVNGQDQGHGLPQLESR